MDKFDDIIAENLRKESEAIRSFKFKGRIVRHFKGDLYLVLDFAQHTETREVMVIYKALYDGCTVYARPYNMFNEKVPEGKKNPTGQKYRMELYEIESVVEE
jgi:hypothetical protein